MLSKLSLYTSVLTVVISEAVLTELGLGRSGVLEVGAIP